VRPPRKARTLWPAIALIVASTVVLSPLSSSWATARPLGAVISSPRPSLGGSFVGIGTWDGQNLSSASTPAGAFSLQSGDTAAVRLSYVGPGAAQVGNSTLVVTYLGLALTTSRAGAHVVGGPPITGASQINWSFGSLSEALEGVFQLTVSLLFQNGSSAWSESFYVFVKAPYELESGAVVVLLILVAAELYWGLAAIREARKGRRPGSGSTAPAPSTGSQPGEGTTPAAPPGTGSPPGPSDGPTTGPSGSGPADTGSGGGSP